MKIRTGGCTQTEASRIPRPGYEFVRCMRTGDNLYRHAAQTNEFAEQTLALLLVQRITAGMGEHGHPAAAIDPVQRIAQPCPLVRHITGFPGVR